MSTDTEKLIVYIIDTDNNILHKIEGGVCCCGIELKEESSIVMNDLGVKIDIDLNKIQKCETCFNKIQSTTLMGFFGTVSNAVNALRSDGSSIGRKDVGSYSNKMQGPPKTK